MFDLSIYLMMLRSRFFFAVLTPLLLQPASDFAQQAPDSNEIRRAINYAESIYHDGCYMCKGKIADTVLPDYEGLPVKVAHYSVCDIDGTVKHSTVLLLNPTAELASRWIVNACLFAKKRIDYRTIRKINDSIAEESGFQFPIRGVVFEDLATKSRPKNQIFEGYTFVNGVTVHLTNVHLPNGYEGLYSTEDIANALQPKINSINPYKSGKARLMSTLPAEFHCFHPGVDISGLKWIELVKSEYISAWKTGNNELINVAAASRF